MTNNAVAQQIAQQRQAIERQRQEIERARLAPLTRAQLQRQTLAQAQARKGQFQTTKRQATRQLTSQEAGFETQVAQVRPGLAKPKYLEPQYQKAKESISKQITRLTSLIKSKQAKIAEVRARPQTERTERHLDDLRSDLQTYQAEKGGWSSGLAGSKADVVQKHLSGYTSSFAGFQGQKVQAQFQRAEAKKQFRAEAIQHAQDIKFGIAELGFATTQKEFAAIYKDLPAVVQKHIISPTKVEFRDVAPVLGTGQAYGPQLPSGWVKPELTPSPEFGVVEAAPERTVLSKIYGTAAHYLGKAGLRAEEIYVEPVKEFVRDVPEIVSERVVPSIVEFAKPHIERFAELDIPIVDMPVEQALYLPPVLGVGPIGIGPSGRDLPPTGVTIGAAPSRAADFISEMAAKGAEISYEETIGRLPPEYQFGRFVATREERRKLFKDLQTGKIKSEDIDWSMYIDPYTPEEVGKVVEVGARIVPYAIPGVAPFLLASDVLAAKEDYQAAPELAKKEAEKTWKEYDGDISKEEYMSIVVPQLETEIKNQALLTMGISGGFLVGGGVVKGVTKATRFFKDPIITKIPTRKVKTPFFKEKVVTVIDKGKPVRVSKYRIVGETRPPIKVIETTRFRELFKIKPKKEYLLPPKGFVQFTPTPVIGKKPFLVGEIRTGQRYGTFYKLKGASIPKDFTTLKGMTKTRQFEWQRLAEEIAGRPVSLKNVPKILSKNAKKVESYIEAERLFRLKKIKEDTFAITTPWKPGKAITRAEAVSEIKLLKETDKLRILKIETIVKDVTFPGARAIGKTPKLKGVITELKEPIYLDVGKGVTYIRPITITKTPFTKTFQIQETKLLPKLPLPKIEPTIPTRVVLKSEIVGEGLPYMVGGTGLAISDIKVTVPPKVDVIEIIERAPDKVLDIDLLPVKVGVTDWGAGLARDRIDITPRVISIIKPALEIKPIVKLEPLTKMFQPTVIKPISRVVQVPRAIQVPRLKVTPRLRVAPSVAVTPAIIPRITPRPLKKPVIHPPIIMLEVPSMKRRPPKKKLPPEVGYGIEIRRKGKWEKAKIPYAFATEEGAHAVGMEKTVKEAAASYRLVKSKKPVKRTRKKPSALHKVMFRPGKEKNVMVQKKLLRITTPGEIRQISLKGAAARRGVSTWGIKKPKKVVKKKSIKKKKKVLNTKNLKGRKK